MKLTNSDIMNLAAAIADAGRDGDKPRNLPWRVAYALARTSTGLKPHLEAMDVARKAMFETHGGGVGGVVKRNDPGHAALMKELSELNSTEVDVSVHRFKLADIEGVSMAPVTLAALLPLIDEPPAEKATP